MNSINESFFVYERKISKIYQELNLLKESYSIKEYNLILEGFWDKMKGISSNVGSKIGQAKNDIKDKYDKGVEYGRRALEAGKEFYNKVSSAINSSIEAIKKSPSKLWDAITSLSNTIFSNLSQIYIKNKERGKEWINSGKEIMVSIFNKFINRISKLYHKMLDWATRNKSNFNDLVHQKSDQLVNYSEKAKKSSIEVIKNIGDFILANAEKIKNGAIQGTKITGMIILGLIVLPIYFTYLSAKKTYEIGEEFAEAFKTGINTLKTNLGDVWQAGVEGYRSTQKPIGESLVIKNFSQFLKNP